MKVRITIGTTYCGCPSESFEIEVESIEDFKKSDAVSTAILDAITSGSHYFIDYDYDEDEDDYDDKD